VLLVLVVVLMLARVLAWVLMLEMVLVPRNL
jgi:hypothetical protein